VPYFKKAHAHFSNQERSVYLIQTIETKELLMATMYTVQETADYLGVSKKTVYKWVAEGSLKGQKIGKRMIRIDELDLYSFIRPVTH